METRRCLLTWRSHEVHCGVMPGQKWRWEKREWIEEEEGRTHRCAWEASQKVTITLRAIVWIVFYIEEKRSNTEVNCRQWKLILGFSMFGWLWLELCYKQRTVTQRVSSEPASIWKLPRKRPREQQHTCAISAKVFTDAKSQDPSFNTGLNCLCVPQLVDGGRMKTSP